MEIQYHVPNPPDAIIVKNHSFPKEEKKNNFVRTEIYQK